MVDENTITPEPLTEKELEELRSGIMRHPALQLLADEKARQRIIFGNIKRPTEYDKDIVQESDNAGVFEKSRFAYLAKELAYIGRHLERLYEEKVEGEIAEWYKRAECAFTYRLIPIQAIYKDVEGALAGRLPNLRGDFRAGYRKLLAVARQSDKDRVRCFGFLPVKPIADFKLAAKEFYETIYAIHTEAHLALDKLKQAGQSRGNAGDEKKRRKRNGFSFNEGQAFYRGKDLGLPAGETVQILKKLVDSSGKVLKHRALDSESTDSNASDILKGRIHDIKKALKAQKIPYRIEAKRGVGYVLQKPKTGQL